MKTEFAKRLIKADTKSEYNGQLAGFAAAFGVDGKPVRGDGEAITSEWALAIDPKEGMLRAVGLKKLGYKVENLRGSDGCISFFGHKGQPTLGTISFDAMKKGDCFLTVAGDQ